MIAPLRRAIRAPAGALPAALASLLMACASAAVAGGDAQPLPAAANAPPDPTAVHAAPADAAPAPEQSPRILVMLRTPAMHYRPQADYSGGYGEQAGRLARQRIAEELAAAHGLRLESEWPMESLGVDCFVMSIADGRPLGEVLQALAQDPRPAWTQAVQAFHALAHNDPLLPLQPAANAWHLSEVHRRATGRHIAVAELDSGVEVHHPDLEGQVRTTWNFVDASPYAAESHGTAVAGVIAARADNALGIAGVAPDARLLALRACWQAGASAAVCDSFTLAKALQFALAHGADIINLSITGPDDRLLGLLLDQALQRGVSVVGAVDPASVGGGFPASHPGVIAVAAEAAAPGGAQLPRVVAPGRDVPTTLPGSRWGFVDGSSFAAAHVSGLVALLKQVAPGLDPQQLRSLLMAPANGTPLAGGVDACDVIARAANACTCGCEVAGAGRPMSGH
jgi:hypothetical protein